MDKVFIEELKTESKYNEIPKGMRSKQIVICTGCEYRTFWMQYGIAKEEACKKGGSPRDYLSGFYITPIPSCQRKTCILDDVVLRRSGFRRSSFSKEILLKQQNMTKLQKRSRN